MIGCYRGLSLRAESVMSGIAESISVGLLLGNILLDSLVELKAGEPTLPGALTGVCSLIYLPLLELKPESK